MPEACSSGGSPMGQSGSRNRVPRDKSGGNLKLDEKKWGLTPPAQQDLSCSMEPRGVRGVRPHFFCPILNCLILLLLSLTSLQAQTRLTSPKEQFGFDIGDDYVLANYTQYVDYLKKLDQE